jgi:hypothetical protein
VPGSALTVGEGGGETPGAKVGVGDAAGAQVVPEGQGVGDLKPPSGVITAGVKDGSGWGPLLTRGVGSTTGAMLVTGPGEVDGLAPGGEGEKPATVTEAAGLGELPVVAAVRSFSCVHPMPIAQTSKGTTVAGRVRRIVDVYPV